ncbi:hypothetical protein STEG23_010554, partial [Scotinomys teguina]
VDLAKNSRVHKFLGYASFFAGMAVLSGPPIAGGQKRAADLLELELQIAVNVGAGNGSCVL